MQEHFYFNGRQIKNYLIGFASLFAEIPYKNRVGQVKTVPIHYGSPSDVISHLENNVDNEATKNRNRLKDISVPMFSFRMTGIERNPEKRRAPHDTLAVDLRPLGYNVGYVAMRPAPYRFTMELVCWASSDYQAFEITEQIIPYFNSPQQVIIEPLPRCPVSTTEIFLDNVEIDTEPDSQKYSALITMTFSLTGFILSQPRVWSTNMAFELSLLDTKGNKIIPEEGVDYGVGHEIRDLNVEPTKPLPSEDKFSSIEGFILNTPSLLSEYGEKLDFYKILVENGRLDQHGNIIDSTELTVEYKGVEKIFYPATISYIVDEMDEVRYLFENEKLRESLGTYKIEGSLSTIDELFGDYTETIYVYLKLLDRNLATVDFNPSGATILNSEKLALFGSARIDTDDVLARLKTYLAGLEFVKLYKDVIDVRCNNIISGKDVFVFENEIPYENLPTELQAIISPTYLTDNNTLSPLEFKIHFDVNDNLIITTLPNVSGNLILETDSSPSITSFTTLDDGQIIINSVNFPLNETFGIIIQIDGMTLDIHGVVALDSNVDINPLTFDYSVFGLNELYNIGINSEGKQVSFELDEYFYKMYDCSNFLDTKITELNGYVVTSLLYNVLQKELYDRDKMLNVVTNKFKFDYDTVIEKACVMKHFINKIKGCIDFTQDNLPTYMTDQERNVGQQIVSPDLAQTITRDNDGKIIYDVNKDGFINKEDLDILGANVDNPDDYDYKLVSGVWHKRDKVEELSSERLEIILKSLKTVLYIMEKENYIEIYDFINLFSKDLVVSSYDLYPDTNEFSKKYKEIAALGYDVDTLEVNFVYMRNFLNSIKCIMVDELEYLLYRIPDMNEKSKKLLLTETGVNLDKIVIGKYLELYLNSFIGDERLDKEYEIRDLLVKPLGEYLDYVYEYNLMIKDISEKSTLFNDCLTAETEWLDGELPDIKLKIEDKYGNP